MDDMINAISEQEQHILLHSLGLTYLRWYEKDKINKPYRNRFYTSKSGDDYTHIESLINKGLMQGSGRGWEKDYQYFFVTDKGLNIAKTIALKSIKEPSRSKKRYELYLHCDVDESFGEWIKNKYWNDYRKRHGVS